MSHAKADSRIEKQVLFYRGLFFLRKVSFAPVTLYNE